MKSLPLAAAVLAAAGAAASAQTTQSASRAGQMNGACGQPLALTYSLAMPVDQIPAAPLDAAFLRGEPFYLEFALAAPGRVVLRTDTADSAADPIMTLFDTTGTALVIDDDGAGGLDALIDTMLEAGTYCAQVRPISGIDGRQAVTLDLATGAAAEALAATAAAPGPAGPMAFCTDPALTMDPGRTLAPGMGSFTLQASIEAWSHRDWWLRVDQPMDLQIDAASSRFDTILTLVDGAGTVVAENDDAFGANTDSRIALRVAPGSYCLSLSGYGAGAGPAEITFSDAPEAPVPGPIGEACTDPALTHDFGSALAPGFGTRAVPASLPPGSRSDWRIEVAEGMLLRFDAGSDEIDMMLTLLDGAGQVIEENDDGPDGIDSRITRTLGPGTYCLAAASYNGAGGAFELAVSDSPAAPDPGESPFCAAPETTAQLGRDIAPGFGRVDVPATLANGAQDFAFEVTAETALRFDARSDQLDTVLRLAAADGTFLAENDDSPEGGTDSRLDWTLAPGAYCLRLESFDGDEGAAGLALTERDPAALAAEAVERGKAVPPAGSGIGIDDLGTLTDRLETNRLSEDLTKWVAFTLDSDGAVRIDAIALGGSFTLRLFAEDGTAVTEAFGGGGISPARIEERLHAGRYLLAVALDPAPDSRLRNIVITRAGG